MSKIYGWGLSLKLDLQLQRESSKALYCFFKNVQMRNFSWAGVGLGGVGERGGVSEGRINSALESYNNIKLQCWGYCGKGFPHCYYLGLAVLCSNWISVYTKYFKQVRLESSCRNGYIVLDVSIKPSCMDNWGPCFGRKIVQLSSAITDFLLWILLHFKTCYIRQSRIHS